MTIIVARISPWLVLGLGLMLATMPAWRLLLRGSSPTVDNLPSVPLYAANRLQFAILFRPLVACCVALACASPQDIVSIAR
jgi:hypothetical protein